MPLRDHFRPPLDRKSSWEGVHGGWPMMIVAALVRKLPPQYVAEPRVHLGAMVEIDVATLTIPADLPAQDEYEVRVYDTASGRRLVAAIEIVSPANKDRPDHRRAFVAKCAALLREQVSVVIVDLVTTRHFNLYHDLLELTDQTDPAFGVEPPSIYAVACRSAQPNGHWVLDAWFHPLVLGAPLPTLPLWLADDFAIPLELESSYEESCRILRLPSLG